MNTSLYIFLVSGIYIYLFKGTVSIISSDPECKDGIVQSTVVPLKPFSDQYCGIVVFLGFKVFKSDNSYLISCKVLRVPRVNLISFQNYKH